MIGLTISPFFGLVLSMLSYMVAKRIYALTKGFPLFNPLLVSMALCVGFLFLFNIPIENFMIGGSYITFLILPATVALIYNLYLNIELLKANLIPIIAGIIVGVVVHSIVVLGLAKVFLLDNPTTVALYSKSVTLGVGQSLCLQYGGHAAINVITTTLTGIVGSTIATTCLHLTKMKDPVAKGIALGTSSHALGTAKALDLGPTEGAMAGLSMALTGIITVVLTPLLLGALL